MSPFWASFLGVLWKGKQDFHCQVQIPLPESKFHLVIYVVSTYSAEWTKEDSIGFEALQPCW